jgi:hypothetical protein
MRQSSSLLALVAVAAACSSPDRIADTDSGGVNGGTGGMISLDTTATTAPTTSGATTAGATTTAPGVPTTTDSASSSTSGDHTTSPTSITTLPVETTGTVDLTTTTGGESTTSATTGSEPVETWTPKDCPPIFAQDLLPTFEIEISKSELSSLKSEWKAADEDKTTEHPLISFKFGDNVATTATARLRGNDIWWSGQGDKMQLQISFNTFDKKARFMGLRKLLFDAAEYNKSFLRDRLSMAVFRDVGLPAPCANNARVVINGEYHGLFTSIEKVDKELLERYFEDPEGNLYKNGGEWEKKTNEANLDMTDLDALLAVKSIADLDAAMNLDEAILEWAAEAVLPDGDGAWAGGLNFYLYNDPKAGFNVIPWDKDATFTRLDFDTDPYAYLKPDDHGRPFYNIATDDPAWFKKYIEAIAYVLEHGYKVDVLQARIDAWSAQIATAVAEDSNKPFPTSEHLVAVQEKRAFVAQRHAYLKAWLECWQNGGKKKGKKCSPP